MSRTPRVSIGLPIFDGENLMRRSIESLLSQTFVDFELIISDNASVDSTGRIAQEYASKDERVRYIRQDRNIGAFLNFEAVLGAARGTYFMWAAADDYYGPTHVADLIVQLDKHPEAVVAMSGTHRFSDDGSTLDVIAYPPEDDPNTLSNAALAWRLAAGELYHFYIYGMFRRAYLAGVYPSVPAVKGGDRLFIWKLALTHRFRYTGKVTYFRRMSATAAHIRYQRSDPNLALLYRSNLSYLKTWITAGRYLFSADNLASRMKLLLPIMLARYGLFLLCCIAREQYHAREPSSRNTQK